MSFLSIGKFPFCIPQATGIWSGSGTPGPGQVGPGTGYPVGVAEDDAMRWYWQVKTWRVSGAFTFSGTRAHGDPTSFSHPFGTSGTVTSAATQNALVCPTSVSGSDGIYTFRLWDSTPRAYSYGGLIYPAISLSFNEPTGAIGLSSTPGFLFPKRWVEDATIDGYSVPLWYDEAGNIDSIDGVPGDNANGNGYNQSRGGTGTVTVAATYPP